MFSIYCGKSRVCVATSINSIFRLSMKATCHWSTSQLARPLIICALPQHILFDRVTARSRKSAAPNLISLAFGKPPGIDSDRHRHAWISLGALENMDTTFETHSDTCWKHKSGFRCRYSLCQEVWRFRLNFISSLTLFWSEKVVATESDSSVTIPGETVCFGTHQEPNFRDPYR